MSGTETVREVVVTHGYGFGSITERYEISSDAEQGEGLSARLSRDESKTRFIPVAGGAEAASALLGRLDFHAKASRSQGVANPYIDAEGVIRSLYDGSIFSKLYDAQPQQSPPRM